MGESSMLPVLRSPLTCEVMDFGNHEFDYKITGFPNLELPLPARNCRKTGYVQMQTIPISKRKFVLQRSTKSCPFTSLRGYHVDTIERGSARKLRQVVGDKLRVVDGRPKRNALSSPKTGIHRAKGDLSAPPSSFRELEFLVFLGRTLCMRKTLLVVLLLAATAAVAATPDSNSQAATTTPVIRHYLMPDHSIKSVFPDLLSQSKILAPQADTVAGATKLGFCQCGCGIRCSTSADCGGAACRPFITCCARKSQNPEIDWFTRSFESSSHKTDLPDAILKEVLKTECK